MGSVPVKNMEVHEAPPDGLAALVQSLRHKQDHRQPFYILDLAAVERLTSSWRVGLTNVVPYYAVKCKPQPMLMTALAAIGAHFDCASLEEIKSAMAYGVDSKKIVYANPFKSEAHIQYAARVGVNLNTFDSIHELKKIKRWHPECDLLLRIKPPNDEKGSWRPLGTEFGALPGEVVQLLKRPHGAGLRVVGVFFHVGSKANDPELYRGAIASSRGVFDAAAQLKLPPMHVLNIGGGRTARASLTLLQSYSQPSVNTFLNAKICTSWPSPEDSSRRPPSHSFEETGESIGEMMTSMDASDVNNNQPQTNYKIKPYIKIKEL